MTVTHAGPEVVGRADRVDGARVEHGVVAVAHARDGVVVREVRRHRVAEALLERGRERHPPAEGLPQRFHGALHVHLDTVRARGRQVRVLVRKVLAHLGGVHHAHRERLHVLPEKRGSGVWSRARWQEALERPERRKGESGQCFDVDGEQ